MNSKRRVLFIRKVQSTLKDSLWSLVKTLLSDAGIYDQCKLNQSNYEMTLPNGSEFIFKGLDDSEKIKSVAGVTDIVIEEATELTLDDFTQLNIRLRPEEPNPQIFLMFNPVSKANWVYENLIINTPSNARVVQTTYLDNKFLNEEYKQELEKLKDTNPAYYKIYCLGEFATLDKLIFPNYEKRILDINQMRKNQELKFFAAIDFGYVNDPSAIIWGMYDKANKTIYVLGEYVKKGMLNDEIAKTLINLGLSKEKIFADCAEQKSIAEIKRYGLRIEPCKKGKDSIIQGIQWLQQNHIVIDERCTNIIDEFENYTWKKDRQTGEYINEPIDTFNHCIDALRYGVQECKEGGNVYFLKRNLR